jgi:hypothetical protein
MKPTRELNPIVRNPSGGLMMARPAPANKVAM